MHASIARPNWPTDVHWPQVLSRADRLSVRQRAAAHAAVARVYTVAGQSICAMEHQVTWRQSTWPGRLELLEQGHAAACEALSRRFIDRLRHPREHFGAAAELNARQMVRYSGATLSRAPKGKVPGLAEFLARWASGAEAIVEVKALRQGDAMNEADRVVVEAQHLLQRLARDVAGFRGRLEWAPALINAPPDGPAILVAVHFAIARAKAPVHAGRECCIPVDGIGMLHLIPDAGGPELRLDYGTYAPSNEAIYERLRRPAEKAMKQIATHPQLPGIIVLDVDACGLARNGLDLLETWAAGQPQLGVIIVIEREHAATASYGNVRFLHGPRVSEVAEVGSAFECCDAGHLHYQPLCTPATPCESLFWLSRYEA